MRVGLLTEYPSLTVQSGPALKTQQYQRTLTRRGHQVVLIGPDTGDLAELGDAQHHLFYSFGFPTHPRTKVPLPAPLNTLLSPPRLDVIDCQAANSVVHYALWLREMWRVPLVNTHTIHLPTHGHFLLSDRLYNTPLVRRSWRRFMGRIEAHYARIYNQGDLLVVQSRHLVDYWRARGVSVPIEILTRPVDPARFSVKPGRDPFPVGFAPGGRLLVVCRHDREKRLDHLLRVFDEQIAPANPRSTLTLLGDGRTHDELRAQAAAALHGDRILLAGEVDHAELVSWYSNADLFVYTSLSETFGNVINEALWCGLPVVALDDGMGVAQQVDPQVGELIAPGSAQTDQRFARACLQLCRDEERRHTLGQAARRLVRQRSHPDTIFQRLEELYAQAQEHCRRAGPRPLCEQSRLLQAASFINNIGSWAMFNGVVFYSVAQLATRL